MQKKLHCPQCDKVVAWQGNPHRPFCSERCRLIDLGQWVDGTYVIPGPEQEPWTEDNIIPIDKVKKDIERS